MDYRTIEIFLDLVQTRNITKTAQRLYLSQPTVSKRLQILEEELNCQLICRMQGKREILLTRQGLQFIPLAEKWKRLQDETESLTQASLSSIAVGISESAYYSLIAPFIRRFLAKHEDVRVVADIYNSDTIYDFLDNHLLDFGIVAYDSERADIRKVCIEQQRFCIIRWSENPQPDLFITPQELDPAKEIIFTGGNFRGMKQWRENWFEGKRQSRLELNTIQGIVPFLQGSDYWALCTSSMARSIARDVSLQIYQLQDCRDTWEIFFLKKDQQTARPAAQETFEEELLAYVQADNEKNMR